MAGTSLDRPGIPAASVCAAGRGESGGDGAMADWPYAEGMKPALPAPKRNPPPPVAANTPRTEAVRPGDRPMSKGLLVLLLLIVGVAAVREHGPARQRVERAMESLSLPATGPRDAPAADRAGIDRGEEPQLQLAAEAPEQAERIAEVASILLQRPLRPISDLSSEGMQAELGPSGQVLLTSKYRILRFGAGNPNDRRSLFSFDAYLEQFPGAKAQAMASALALPGERYLFGGWHGEVLSWSDGRLRRLSGRDDRPRGRIADFLPWRGEVLVAGDGLWRVAADGRGLEELPLTEPRRLRALAARGDQLLLAGESRGIYQWRANRAVPWLELPGNAERVEVLAPAADGGWWIGSTRALYRVDREGNPLETLLEGVWISAVLERPDELWVGSWKQGLLLRRNGRWHRLGDRPGDLPSGSVSAFAVDAADHAWLMLYGGGGWQAPLDSLRAEMLERPWMPAPDAAD